MRTFISVEIPEEAKKKFVPVNNLLRNSGLSLKLVKIKNLHLTLKFLGEITKEKLKELIESCRIIGEAFSPFSLRLKSIGIFPNIKRPRIVWAGVEKGKENLKEIIKLLEEELEKRGFPVKGLSQNTVDHLPEVILERDKEQRVLRSRATQMMSDVVAAQKDPGPSGSPIFKVLQRCSSVMCHRHKTFLAPCTNLKSGTPNSQHYFETAPKKREFQGHLTLARVRRTAKGEKFLENLVEEFKEEQFCLFPVTKFYVMKSELKKEGPTYTVLEEISLKKM